MLIIIYHLFLKHIGMSGLQEFAKRFAKFDPAICYVAVAFLIACMIWAFPVLFLRDDVLGKVIMVSAIIAITMYHRIAGIIALIVVIAMLNQTPNKEGMLIPTTSTSSNALSNALSTPLSNASSTPLVGSPPSSSSSISFKTPAEFRQKYCTKGYADDLSGQGKLNMSYMLSPAFFTKMDASGNPQLTNDEITAIQSMDPASFSQCKPTTIDGQEQRQTIANMCDPACNWTIKPASTPTPTPTPTPTSTTNAEGFTPMLRPHIRTGRRMMTDGMDKLKSTANRLKRQFF
jgi:hypothetical protein